MGAGPTEVARPSRTLRRPGPSGPPRRPRACPLRAPEPGAGSRARPGRLYLPRPRRLPVSAARAPGVICSRPAGPLPAFPPGRGHRGDWPLPPYRPPPRGRRGPPPHPGRRGCGRARSPPPPSPQDASSQICLLPTKPPSPRCPLLQLLLPKPPSLGQAAGSPVPKGHCIRKGFLSDLSFP